MKNRSRNNVRRLATLILAIATALALTGCGAKSQTVNSMAVAETVPGAATDAGWGAGGAADTSWGDMDPAEIAEESISPESPVQSPQSNRKLIRTVRLNVETREFDALLKSVNEKIGTLGGYTEQSDVSGRQLNRNGEPISRYASLTVRIPSQHLDSFVSGVEESGNVTNKSESVEDVTLQYSDVESKKKSLEIEQERIWALLEKADTLEAVIALEERLSEIRYELESMESRLRLYDNQVEYSTVHLYIDEVKEEQLTPTAPLSTLDRIQRGFSNNLAAMGRFFVNLLALIIMLIPVWVPIGLIIFLCWRLIRRRKLRKKDMAEKDLIQNYGPNPPGPNPSCPTFSNQGENDPN